MGMVVAPLQLDPLLVAAVPGAPPSSSDFNTSLLLMAGALPLFPLMDCDEDDALLFVETPLTPPPPDRRRRRLAGPMPVKSIFVLLLLILSMGVAIVVVVDGVAKRRIRTLQKR